MRKSNKEIRNKKDKWKRKKLNGSRSWEKKMMSQLSKLKERAE